MQVVEYGVRTSGRTVLVLSRQFVDDIWPCVADVKALSGRHVIVLLTDSSCDVPRGLLELATLVDASSHHRDLHWWHTLTRLINDTHDGISATT